MAEVQARGSGTRGRGGFRGGRGGFRGGRNPSRSQHKADNEQENIPPASVDDQGEVGELKKKFGEKLPLLKEICPGWSDEDLVYALQETDGDVDAAVDRISSGTISQWGEVKKKHPKPKEAPTVSTESGTRGRGRGAFESRGRGRGAERGARGGRGSKSVAHTNGTKKTDDWDTGASAQAAEAAATWDSAPANGETTSANEDWANDPGKDALASLQTEEPKPASAAAPSTAKPGGWAGLFAKPAPAPKKSPAPPPPAAQPEQSPAEAEARVQETAPTESILLPPIEPAPSEGGPSELPSAPHSETGKDLTPPKDELTEKNLEKLPDSSHPHPSATAASTVATTQDPLASIDASKPAVRPGISGYAATALKATSGTGRAASYARKVMEQHEAVVMPGHHAVEKAAVQFGKLGLGVPDDVDVDEDREEPETRTQLPDDSPAAPRASLPPSLPETQQGPAAPPTQPAADVQASLGRQAPGLPPVPQQAQEPSPQSSLAYADQYRYGQGQKPYDPFGQQPPTAQPPTQAQEPFSNQVPSQPGAAPSQNDYSAYYGRDAYNYYGAYGHGHEAQRAGSTFGTSAPDTQGQYATARPQQALGQQDAPGSGNNTPIPTGPSSHQAQPSGHVQQTQGHGYPGYGYPNAYSQQYPQYGASYVNQVNQVNHRYGSSRPMFDDVRRQDSDYYPSQYNYPQQSHYGAGYKSNMYGQPQQGYSYDQASSPATANTFGREGSYGRSGSVQPSEAQPTAAGSTGFGGVPDPFGRTSSGFGQTQQHAAHSGGDDPAKGPGPSPSMQGGRPTSAVNSFPGQGVLPPPSQHSGQQAFAGYPQYGGLGTVGGHQNTHQNTGYGGYGSNTGFGTYGGYGGGRGWNNSYGSGH
ncbi:hypothetical protein A1O3_06790 [Capronia epimyces CBS 606.96]|uniref:RNA polymerase II degradation factor 1 n=1 Tax=Capronia epimyces CBS 606.96 TaxID=1182542 RepID=W9XRY6_9EURO|nr:uncharacterized protein A1O3_06790 [Capronia epimyces CBS 606.96]EXJ82973.1 hypothetical protein A1O3_06790 [Capronia epimyces CBS 606.96]